MFFFPTRTARRRAVVFLLCLAAGLAVIALVRSTLGEAGGALLVAAAVAVAMWRPLDRRAHVKALLENHSTFAPTPSRLAATVDLVHDLLPPLLGHEDIDREHRRLATKAATLRVAFFHEDDAAEIELLVHELLHAMTRHLQSEITALAGLGVARRDDELDAERLLIANAEYDFHLYCTGDLALGELVERVAGALVAGHLARRHPALPPMQAALQRLRDVKA